MDTKELFKRLVENALDFLARSIEELRDRPKYSVIHFHAAVELFLKARLMSDHWSLIVTKRQEPDWEKFIKGEFQSVSLDEAASKLEKTVRSGLTDQELCAFRDVTKHRNKMLHFFHDVHTAKQDEQLLQTIAKQQLNAWYLLDRLLNVRWKNVFEAWSDQIKEIDGKLREHHAFLQVVFDHLGKDIQKRKEGGSAFETCPSCGFESQENQQELDEIYEAVCLVCGLIEKHLTIKCVNCGINVRFVDEGFSKCGSCGENFGPEDVARILLDEREAYLAAKDGDDSWDLGNCSDCDGYHTVVRIDYHNYICTSCFERFSSLQRCGWCNERNTGDMEDSYYSGCNQCEGKLGADTDD
ncbi:MAG: hypothetical protein ABSD50_13635 [Smithella sp.]